MDNIIQLSEIRDDIEDLKLHIKFITQENENNLISYHHINDLMQFGSRGYVYNSAEILTSLLGDERIMNSTLARQMYEEAVAKTGTHVGKYFKLILNSNDTVFDSISTINQLVENQSAMTLICNTEIGIASLTKQASWLTPLMNSNIGMRTVANSLLSIRYIGTQSTVITQMFNNTNAIDKLFASTIAVNQMDTTKAYLDALYKNSMTLNRMVKSSTAKILGMHRLDYISALDTALKNTTYWEAYSIPELNVSVSNPTHFIIEDTSSTTARAYIADFNGFALLGWAGIGSDNANPTLIINDGIPECEVELYRYYTSQGGQIQVDVNKYAYRSLGYASRGTKSYTQYKNVIKYIAK